MTKAERTRHFIIETTAPLFNKKGFYGTSMSDITKATGLTKGSIYGNFKNKDELAIEAFRYNLHLLSNKILQKISVVNSSIEKLLVFVEFYRDNFLQVFERGGCAILNTGIEADDNHPVLREVVKKSLLSFKTTIEKIVEEGTTRGEIRDAKPSQFSSFFVALIEGSIFLSKTTGLTSPISDNLDLLEKEILKLKK